MCDNRQPSRQERTERECGQVLSWAVQVGLVCEQLNDGHHLKVGSLNFFPSSGKITRDGGARAGPEKGAEAFIKLAAAIYGKPHSLAPEVKGSLKPIRLRIVP